MPGSKLIEDQERLADKLAEVIAADMRTLAKAIGERPFGTERNTPAERLDRYMLVRDDPQAWAALITTHGPKAAVKYGQEMERLMGRTGGVVVSATPADPMMAEQPPAPMPVEPAPAMAPPGPEVIEVVS